MGQKKNDKAPSFREAAEEAGEARPLDEVLRRVIKPVRKKNGGRVEPTAAGKSSRSTRA